MSEDAYERIGRIPTFDGESKKFQTWWKKFCAYATMAKFRSILKSERDPNLPEKERSEYDESEASEKEAMAIRKNEMAMSSFATAFTTEGLMNLIHGACSEEWPEGEAHLVVKELLKKYRPIDTVSRVELRQQLNKVCMKKGSDPALLFEQLNSIQNQYLGPGNRIFKEDLIAVVLDVATEEYQGILAVERRLKGDALTLGDLENAMTKLYRQTNRGKTSRRYEGEEGTEMLLAGFMGKCYQCRQSGHKAKDCTKRKESYSKEFKKFKGKCGFCNKKGHMIKDFWHRDAKKGSRDQEVKNDTAEVEILMMANELNILEDPDVWIANMAATVHTTPYQHLLEDERIHNSKIVMGNRMEEKATLLGNLSGTIMEGKHQKRIQLTDVVYMPNGKYNLFSITQILNKGWLMSGNKKKLLFQKIL